jgi:outer membrane protein OmpA-like peptidoglycan-associated protein
MENMGNEYVVSFEKNGNNSELKNTYPVVKSNWKRIDDNFEITMPSVNAGELFPASAVITNVGTNNTNLSDSIHSGLIMITARYTIYYSYKKHTIALPFTKTLDSVVYKLQADPELAAIIGSFTDCAGTDEFNMNLSAQRSKAVIKYLIAKGIKRNRIIESHYGKEYLLKACEETKYHSSQQGENRRTEILLSEIKTKTWLDIQKSKN